MPLNPDNSVRSFTTSEIAAMQLQTTDVRTGAHPTETREIDQSTMRRMYFCAWAQRYNAVELIVGMQSYYFGADGAYHISRSNPDPVWGTHPYAYSTYATKIERISGFGKPSGVDANGMPQYPRARLDVLFTTVPYKLSDDTTIISGGNNEIDRYVWAKEIEGGGDSITGKGNMIRFRTNPPGVAPVDGSPIPYSYNVIRPTTEWSLVWERVPYAAIAPGTKLDTYIRQGLYRGMINSVPFYQQAPGTVMFVGCSMKQQRPQVLNYSQFTWTWSVELKFLSTPYGHLALRYFDLAGAGVNNGWYYAGTGPYKTPATLTDYESVVQGARDLNNLFIV